VLIEGAQRGYGVLDNFTAERVQGLGAIELERVRCVRENNCTASRLLGSMAYLDDTNLTLDFELDVGVLVGHDYERSDVISSC